MILKFVFILKDRVHPKLKTHTDVKATLLSITASIRNFRNVSEISGDVFHLRFLRDFLIRSD